MEDAPLIARVVADDDRHAFTTLVPDIFDALTASDRPYKKALSADRAIEILDMEAKAGMLDRSVVELLLASELHHKILDTDWREL